MENEESDAKLLQIYLDISGWVIKKGDKVAWNEKEENRFYIILIH